MARRFAMHYDNAPRLIRPRDRVLVTFAGLRLRGRVIRLHRRDCRVTVAFIDRRLPRPRQIRNMPRRDLALLARATAHLTLTDAL